MIKRFFLVLTFLIAVNASAEESLPDPLKLMERCKQSYQNLNDYTATFIKEQRLRGRLRKPETTFLKFQKPFSIYMKWIKNPDKGKEVIYVEGAHNGKILAHLGGVIGLLTPTTFRLEPTHPMAMGGNLKPITKAGLGNMIGALLAIYQLAEKNGDLESVCKGVKRHQGRDVYVVERTLPKKEIYPNNYAVIYVDKELMLPVFYAAFDDEDRLLEQYEYRDLKLNVGLTEKDFDKKNSEYKYPIF